MKDFASAAMMRLIGLGLARQGLGAKDLDPPSEAHVPLAHKRVLADALLKAHGPVALLRIGEAIDEAPEEPLMTALSLARNPADLISRWRRLERFTHSRHRTEILGEGEGKLVLRHMAVAPHPPPHPAEDLLVFGLLAALFRYCGVEGLRARPCGSRIWRLKQDVWSDGSYPADVSTWELSWDGVKTDKARPRMSGENGDWTEAARKAFAADPGRSWTITVLAGELGASPRSLQRRLREASHTYSKLLTIARLNEASNMLGTAGISLAEIGYACGFSDQAHFTREFKKHIGTTPSNFRAQFAV